VLAIDAGADQDRVARASLIGRMVEGPPGLLPREAAVAVVAAFFFRPLCISYARYFLR